MSPTNGLSKSDSTDQHNIASGFNISVLEKPEFAHRLGECLNMEAKIVSRTIFSIRAKFREGNMEPGKVQMPEGAVLLIGKEMA